MSPETTALLKRIAAENRLWGGERIRGELIKLGIWVGKRTVQRHMRTTRSPRPCGQAWATFLHNHVHDVWACDFLPVIDLSVRALFAFFVVDLGSRKVVHIGVTRHPTDAWVAQQLREATPFDTAPRFLIRDNDGTFGAQFAHVAAGSRIEVLRTPVRAPRANATPSANVSSAASGVSALITSLSCTRTSCGVCSERLSVRQRGTAASRDRAGHPRCSGTGECHARTGGIRRVHAHLGRPAPRLSVCGVTGIYPTAMWQMVTGAMTSHSQDIETTTISTTRRISTNTSARVEM